MIEHITILNNELTKRYLYTSVAIFAALYQIVPYCVQKLLFFEIRWYEGGAVSSPPDVKDSWQGEAQKVAPAETLFRRGEAASDVGVKMAKSSCVLLSFFAGKTEHPGAWKSNDMNICANQLHPTYVWDTCRIMLASWKVGAPWGFSDRWKSESTKGGGLADTSHGNCHCFCVAAGSLTHHALFGLALPETRVDVHVLRVEKPDGNIHDSR